MNIKMKMVVDSNIFDLFSHLETKLERFVGAGADSVIKLIGSQLKINVLTAKRPYDLLQSGKFISQLNKTRSIIKTSQNGNTYLYTAMFGDISVLSKIFRKPQRVLVSVKPKFRNKTTPFGTSDGIARRPGFTVSETVDVRGEVAGAARRGDTPFPYLLAIEFGILSKRDEIPKDFLRLNIVTKPGKASSSPYVNMPFGIAPPAGHRKKIHLMLKSGGNNTHPGIKPSRIFRNGLRATRPFIDEKVRGLIMEHWGKRGVLK